MERRISKRFFYTTKVSFGNRDLSNFGFTKNISPEGIVIQSSSSIFVNSTLYISIHDKNFPCTVRGVVIWAKEKFSHEGTNKNEEIYEAGIKILSSDNNFKALIDYLSSKFPERRAYPRIEKELRTVFMNPRIISPAMTKNLSRNGIFIKILGDFVVGDIVKFKLIIDDYEYPPLTITAKIVHIIDEVRAKNEGYEEGIGVEILEFLPNQEKIFEDFLKRIFSFNKDNNF